jgi:hypothetical protein
MIDERAEAHQRAVDDERSSMAAMPDAGRQQTDPAVLADLSPMVAEAVRHAMQDAQEQLLGMVTEAVASRAQELDQRASDQFRALAQEQSALNTLRAEVIGSVTEALPVLVARAVLSVTDRQRAELEALREETECLRAESRVTAAEVRRVVDEIRAAVNRGDGTFEPHVAAYRPGLAEGPPPDAPPPPPSPDVESESPVPVPVPVPVTEAAAAATIVDRTNGGRVAFGKSTVPRARRVERRMLKIDDSDDSDDGPWPGLGRREAELSKFLGSDTGNG